MVKNFVNDLLPNAGFPKEQKFPKKMNIPPGIS